MREIRSVLEEWLAEGDPIALATVVRTWGSSPRKVGAKMALTPDGKIAGSVSGGCVEAAVFESGVEVLDTDRARLLHFGVADETAWQIGLACGGQIDVFVQPIDREMYRRQSDELLAGRSFAVITAIRGPDERVGRQIMVTRDRQVSGSIDPNLDEALIEKACQAMDAGQSQTLEIRLAQDETIEVFIEAAEPQPVLISVGGVHTAIALTSLAKTMGFITIVVDPRRAFGNPERFPHVDRLIQAWPDEAFRQIDITERTAIAMLTHDPKIDDPALGIALRSPAFYIGALGSETTQDKRRSRLREAGITEAELSRLHGPIGLELGSTTPEEIALAIMAQIVAVQHRVIA